MENERMLIGYVVVQDITFIDNILHANIVVGDQEPIHFMGRLESFWEFMESILLDNVICNNGKIIGVVEYKSIGQTQIAVRYLVSWMNIQ